MFTVALIIDMLLIIVHAVSAALKLSGPTRTRLALRKSYAIRGCGVARIGVLLDNFLPNALLQEAARAAEARGFDICWLNESSTGYGKDTPSQLAAVALATSRIRLGTSIIPIYTRTPTLLAQIATSLDEISNGRFILGLGAGHAPNLGANHGLTLRRPFQGMRECVHILREALSTGKVSFDGEIFHIPDLTLLLPSPQRRVPIYLGAVGPRMAELAGQLADGVILTMTTLPYLKEAIPRIKEAARQVGRDPADVDVACLMPGSADPVEGEQMCRTRIANYFLLPFYQNHLKLIGFAPDVERITDALRGGGLIEGANAVSDQLLDTLTLGTNPDRWSGKIEQYRQAGVDIPCLRLFNTGPDFRESLLRGINFLAD